MAATDTNPLADREGFSAFYSRHGEVILTFIARRVYEPQLAMDLTAETFAQAYLSRSRFRRGGEREALAWIHVIARRQISRYYRRGQAERRALQRLGLEPAALSAEDAAQIERLADLGDLRDAVKRGLDLLSHDQRTALQMRVVEEVPYSEIASHLGVSEETVRARVSRGLKALNRSIEHEPAIKEAPA